MSNMNVLIHDLTKNDVRQLAPLPGQFLIIDAQEKAAPCQGCFGCWLKSPGKCVYRDRLQNIGAVMGQANEIVVISKNCYGGYSQGVKLVFDRSISSNLPFFTYRKRKLHHINRYDNRPRLNVYFYGQMTDFEKQIASEFVQANGVNIGCENINCTFLSNIQQLKEIRL